MKKTILISLLCCGFAAADTIDPGVRLNFDNAAATSGTHDENMMLNSVANSTFTISKVNTAYLQYTVPNGEVPAANYPSNASGHAFKSGENTAHFSITGSTLNLESSFTLSFAVQYYGTTPWRNFLAIKANSKEIYFQNDASNGLYFDGTGLTTKDDNATEGSFSANSLKSDSFTHIALVYTPTKDSNGTFTMYVEGVKAEEWNSTFGSAGDITLEIGGYKGTNSAMFYYDEVGLYSAALTQQQIADNLVGKVVGSIPTSTTDTSSIPEPATATLSLLALAGLAARRRRK